MSKVLIKQYYRLGIYSEADIEVFVEAGYISEAEAKAIMENAGA